MLSKNDIKELARTAILYCERSGSTYKAWAETRDFWEEDNNQILKYFNSKNFRTKIIRDNKRVVKSFEKFGERFNVIHTST